MKVRPKNGLGVHVGKPKGTIVPPQVLWETEAIDHLGRIGHFLRTLKWRIHYRAG